VDDVDTIVRILIDTKASSSPTTIDDHDRDVPFWTERWRRYIERGSRARQSLGDGYVFIAEDIADERRVAIGYAAYHHTRRFNTDAELQNIYVLKEWQRRGIGTRLLGVVAHRLVKDGSKTMCVGFDADSPYKQFYAKYGAEIDGAWAIWRDVARLAEQLPRPPLMPLIDEALLDVGDGRRRRMPWWSRVWMR
jgi:GNAT superfamily N-acetyltransferase